MPAAGLFGQAATSPLTLERTIPLPGGRASFDHYAVDNRGARLFLAAKYNHSVEVVDLGSGKMLQTISEIGKPHGIVWVGDTGKLYVTDGAAGTLNVYSGTPFTLQAKIKLAADADDMAYDPANKYLYVGYGGSDAGEVEGHIAIVNTANFTLVKKIDVATHPEGIEVDVAHGRAFANIADSANVTVIDTKSQTIAAIWKLTKAKDNVPLAFDAEHNRLFVGCRTPGRMLMLDGRTGKEMAELPADGGVDDMYYDAVLHRVYLSGGAGYVDVYQVGDGASMHALARVRTVAGAKTSLFDPERRKLYLGTASGLRLYSPNAGK